MNALFSYLPILLAAACLVLLLILLFRQTRQTASGDLSDEYKRQLETVIQTVSERRVPGRSYPPLWPVSSRESSTR